MTCGECRNVTAPGAGFPNHVYCKRFLLHMEKREDASRCWDFIQKPTTNADRIRSMSDEELARFIRDQIIDRNIGIPTDTWLEWLKEEASE